MSTERRGGRVFEFLHVIGGFQGVHIHFRRTHNVQRSAFGALGLYCVLSFLMLLIRRGYVNDCN